MRRLFFVLLPLAILAPATPILSHGQVPSIDAGTASPTAQQRDDMRQLREADTNARAFIRRHAELFYGSECAGLVVPDEAFFRIELDGDESSQEIAVSLGRARCRDYGHNMFTGTGGTALQFWQIQGGRPRLLLEPTVHGFHAQAPYLVTMQHGGFCPGGAGPSPCRIIYRWDLLGRRFETESRQLLDDGWTLHNYNDLTGALPRPPGTPERRERYR